MNAIVNIKLLNVFVSILIAGSIGGILVFFFMWVGEFAALDERIFPKITGRQRNFFGFAGFYLLFLSGIEILNPRSSETMKGLGLTFAPSFLGFTVIKNPEVSIQDLVSLIWLIGLVFWFLMETLTYSRRAFPPKRTAHLVSKHHQTTDFDEEMRKRTKGLSFAFTFSAYSLIIAIIAPALTKPWASNLGLIAVLGVFLISGIFCFIEAIKLGAFFSGRAPQRLKNWLWVFLRVIGPALALYIVIGVAGYVFYVAIPEYYSTSSGIGNDDLLNLVRSITKVVAGVFVILAAYLVGYDDGLAPRIIRFMVSVAVLPLILPVLEIVWNIFASYTQRFLGLPEFDASNPSNFGILLYAVVLLFLPIVFYKWGKHTPSAQKYRIAYTRDISWTPFFMSGNTNKFECKGYSSPEELLEDVVGQTARTRRHSRIPMSFRYQIGSFAGLHQNFDALVLDVPSALRLIDIENQRWSILGRKRKSGRFFMVAGVCKTKDLCLKVSKKTQRQSPIVAYSGAPYLPKNNQLVRLLTKGVKSLTGAKKDPVIEFLPPNCSSDFLSQPYDYLILPEPFATDFKMKSTRMGKSVKAISIKPDNEFTWLIDRYYVLLLRDIGNVELVKDLCDALKSGVQQVNRARGPVAVGHTHILGLAAELDPGDLSELDPLSVALCIDSISLDDVAIADKSHPKGKSNWNYIKERLEHMNSAGIITLTEDQLQDICNFSVISRHLG